MTPSSYNAWKLVSLSPLPTWVLAFLVVVVLAGIIFASAGLRREAIWVRRILLVVIRVAAGAAALFFLFEPGVRNLQVARIRNRLAVLVDRSASMSFPAEVANDQTRSQLVGQFLDNSSAALNNLAERFSVEYWGFDPELTPITAEMLRTQVPRGARTDILGALRAMKGGEQGSSAKKLSAILLFSDGADNVELTAGLNARLKETLKDLRIPVSTFLVGKDALKDLAVEQAKVDDFAFVRNSVTVDVEIHGRGFRGQDVPVVLSREEQIVATKRITFSSADERQTVSFTFTPDQTGRFVYTVSVPVFPDEVVTENNTRSFTLKVIRDRVRVLLVVGRPTWDERFLRGLLKQDPNVDLVSFYILRTLADQPIPHGNEERELSLIPFPMDEIFNTKLDTFDVVIFQNFGYTDSQLSISQYENRLERYVYNGGGLVMIGGDHAFGEGRAIFPTLGRALPVEPTGLPASSDQFRARTTPEGLRHPVTALASGSISTESAWTSLPSLPGANMTRAKAGASVLLDHPFAASGGQNAPILALWDYGRGRSLALTTDSSWYWAFIAHSSGAPTRYYDRFWSNALRWLVRDPDLTTLQVTADPPSVEPGRPVAAIVRARMPDYQPALGADVTVELLSVNNGKVIRTQKGTTGSDGSVRIEIPPPDPGAYKIMASAKKGERELGRGEDALAVRSVGPELADAHVRSDLMEQISKATGGMAFRLPMDSMPNVPLLDPPMVEVGRSKEEPLWDRWYYLVTMVALLGLEWLLRRRFGYI